MQSKTLLLAIFVVSVGVAVYIIPHLRRKTETICTLRRITPEFNPRFSSARHMEVMIYIFMRNMLPYSLYEK